ncbi:MAG: ABC transporter substrate-binding protein [Propylenella sp.]
MRLQLSIALTSNPRTRPIFDGTVVPEGIDLLASRLHPSEMFWRQLRFAEFDVSEMSLSSLMIALAAGDERWIGLPVFTTRKFFHTGVLVRRDAGIESPADLKGKRVGVPEFQQTAALWARGVLAHEFGVDQTQMEFWMERKPQHSHAEATGFAPPPGVTIRQIPQEKSIGSMMVSGELHATLHYIIDSNLIDRSTVDLWCHPEIRTLFHDPLAEGKRYYEKTGIFPVNHGVVVRRKLAEKHPWVVLNLLKAFQQANLLAERSRLEHAAYHLETGLLPADARAALETPVAPHGIAANRMTLETVAQYSFEQGLTPRQVRLEEMFTESVMDH